MSREFTCFDCKREFVTEFEKSVPELELEECCPDCFMASLEEAA